MAARTPRGPAQDARKGCRTCGETAVETHTHGLFGPREQTHEGVFQTCGGCGNRRGSWERKRRPVTPGE